MSVLFLGIVGPGRWSVDAVLARKRRSTRYGGWVKSAAALSRISAA
jgi:hypothetical protein